MHYNVTIPFLHQLDQVFKLQMALSYSIKCESPWQQVWLLTWSILVKSASLISAIYFSIKYTAPARASVVMKAQENFSREV